MRRITVQLPGDTLDRLRELADRDFRDARSQATVLILEGLERRRREPSTSRDEPSEARPREVAL